MSAICLIDTSIFAEILNIPGKSDYHAEVMSDLEEKKPPWNSRMKSVHL